MGDRRGGDTIAGANTLDGERRVAATAERLEQIPRRAGAGSDTHRGYRNESIKLAGCRDRSWNRAPAAEETRAGRGGIAPVAAALAGRGCEERTHDHAHRGRL